jgi:hypothetical protein
LFNGATTSVTVRALERGSRQVPFGTLFECDYDATARPSGLRGAASGPAEQIAYQ